MPLGPATREPFLATLSSLPRLLVAVAFALLLPSILLPSILLLPSIGQAQEVTTDAPPLSDSEAMAFFEARVRPLLAEHCWECHSGATGKSQGSLRLDHGSLILLGGDSGPAVLPGNPKESLLYQAVTYQGYEMPPQGRLPAEAAEVFATWIAQGARWPDETLPEDRSQQTEFNLEERRSKHWSWQPRSKAIPPDLSADAWSHTTLDPFVLDRLRAVGLTPNSEPDRTTLARRLYMDLLGLPPSLEQLDALEQDEDPEWYANLLDRLLADPQFGVRWARHWLDLVRYAQSRGHEFDEDIPVAEEYRDYVVRALNRDIPYDQFVIEHVAGDLIPEPRLDPIHGFNESVLATGFWHLGEWIHSPVDTRKDETDRFDNMVDVFSKTFLGMTVACARCHDHKFDAISTADYYALYGYLQSSDYRLVRFETDPAHRRGADELQQLRVPMQQQLNHRMRERAPLLIDALAASDASEQPWLALAQRLAQRDAIAQSLLKPDDARVKFDARAADPGLWQSDSVIYGPASVAPLTATLNRGASPDRWTIHPWSAAVRDPFWNAMTQDAGTVNRSNRYAEIQEAGKILPTAKFSLDSGTLSYLVRGSFRAFAVVDSHRLIAGPLHGETLLESNGADDEYRWVTHSLPRFRGKTVHLEFSPIENKPFSLVQAIDGPAPSLAPIALDTTVARMQLDQAREALETWQTSRTITSPQQSARIATVLEIALSSDSFFPDTDGTWNRATNELHQAWETSELGLANRLPWHSKLALAMRDGSGINDCVLVRGNHLRPGPEVPRRSLESLDGNLNQYTGKGSGRLELARSLVEPKNPLVARVIVNRLWHHLTGRGIAATTDDLGALGIPPSHPELLDHMANRMIEHGWSIKTMIRSICLSSAYRQDSRVSQLALRSDPENIFLSHARVRRLEAEAVRDSLLSITGQIDLREMPDSIPSVPVHLTEFLTGRGRPGRNGPVDGMGRRSLYLEIRRNFLNPMMTAFDMPSPFSAMGRRNVSNVPAQALILLNDPMLHEISERWAESMLKQDGTDRERVSQMLRLTTARHATEQEIEMMLAFLKSDVFQNPKAAYQSLAHILLNDKELLFRY